MKAVCRPELEGQLAAIKALYKCANIPKELCHLLPSDCIGFASLDDVTSKDHG